MPASRSWRRLNLSPDRVACECQEEEGNTSLSLSLSLSPSPPPPPTSSSSPLRLPNHSRISIPAALFTFSRIKQDLLEFGAHAPTWARTIPGHCRQINMASVLIYNHTVDLKLRGDTVVETKATLKVVRTSVKYVLIYSQIETAILCSSSWTASRAEDPGFESRLSRDFSGVEPYQWLKNWHSSGYPARRLEL